MGVAVLQCSPPWWRKGSNLHPTLIVLVSELGGQDLPDWCSSTFILPIPQNSLKVRRKKPVVSQLSFLSSWSLTENVVAMANGRVLNTTNMDLGTEKMLGSCTPSDEWASVTCQLFGIYLVLYFWYILISCKILVELLVHPTCIQVLWHKITRKKSRRDGSDVSARAPLEPASWAFHWEGQVEVLLWWLLLCFSLLAFTQQGLEQLKALSLPASLALDFCCSSQWGTGDESLRPQGGEKLKKSLKGRFWKVTLSAAQAMERKHPVPSP